MNQSDGETQETVKELLNSDGGKELKKLIDGGDLSRFQGRFSETEIAAAFQKIATNPELRDLLQRNSGIVDSIIEFLKR